MLDIDAPNGLSETDRLLLQERLVADVARSSGAQVIARSDVAAMLDHEQQKQLAGCDEQSCIAEIAGALGVDRLVAAQIGRVGSTWLINLKLLDVGAARVERRATREVRGEVDALVAATSDAVAELFGAAVAPAVGVSPALLPPPPPAAAPPATDEPPPLYRRWWFWAAIGAVLIGGGVTAGVLLGRPEEVAVARYRLLAGQSP